ncbi:MAG: hypothetical protein IPM45_13975 [Acidimicrobiales bacterium]|nr:hypothetical protein [Acidimicrobiales bacterium]
MAKRPIPRIERRPDERPTATRATEAAKAKAKADAEADAARADAEGRPDAPGAAAAKGPDRAADLLRGKGPASPDDTDDTDDTPSGTPTGPAAAASTLPTVSSPARALRDDTALTADVTRRPAFDQGLDDGPDKAEVAAAADASGLGRNPVSTLTDGSVVSGPLADAAAQGDGTTGIAEQGTGAVGVVFKGTTHDFGDHQVTTERVLDDDGRVVKIITSERFDSLRTEENPEGTRTTTEEDFETGLTTTFEHLPDGTKKVTPDPDAPPDDFAVAIPSEDAPNVERAQQFLADNPAVAAQLAQARSGGSGDIDPVDDDTAFGVGAGAIVPDQQDALLGNPGVPGGLAEGGVPQGPDFDGDLGAIDPGPDAVFTGGGIQEDPGDVFGTQPSLAVDLSVPSSSDDEDDTGDDATAAGTTDDGAD